MTGTSQPIASDAAAWRRSELAAKLRSVSPITIATGVAFVVCFGPVIWDLVKTWWQSPDSAHGLLVAPTAIWLAWRQGLERNHRANRWLGAIILTLMVAAMVMGRAAGMATIPRVALVFATAGLVVWYAGPRQLVAWWLPILLLLLTIPIPETLIARVTMPLQGIAASIGAQLLAWRGIPVMLAGNIITVPGHRLFVSEACSGLHSLTALVSMAILLSALFLRTFLGRVLLFVLAFVAAILMNGFRVFLTGFLVVFVSPKLGEGFMHLTEGYLLFLISLAVLGALAFGVSAVEDKIEASRARTRPSSRRSGRRA